MSSQATCDFEFDSLAAANNYRRAIVEKFQPHIQGHALEIGGGIGQISSKILEICHPKHLTIVEPNPDFYRKLKASVPSAEVVAGYEEDLPKERMFNTVVAVNVLEHIESDAQALTNWRKRLLPSGTLCLFVPARPELYSPIDTSFGHFRRYGKKDLRRKLLAAGFKHIEISYFNLLGYFAWLVNFRLLRCYQFNAKQVAWFDRHIFPLSQSIEKKGITWLGQSLWACAKT